MVVYGDFFSKLHPFHRFEFSKRFQKLRKFVPQRAKILNRIKALKG